MKNILALDSSIAQNLVLGLHTKDRTLSKTLSLEHLESSLLSAIDELLLEAQISIEEITDFIIGKGPGSFMGLRLGFSVLRTWAWIYQKPLYTISSLQLLINSINNIKDLEGLIVPCIDGKMQRVFCNITKNHEIILDDSDMFPKDLATQILQYSDTTTPIHLIGTGALLVAPFLDGCNIYTYPQQQITEQCFTATHLQTYLTCSIPNFDKALPNYIRVSAAEMNLNRENPPK